jgi:hypothetical protein
VGSAAPQIKSFSKDKEVEQMTDSRRAEKIAVAERVRAKVPPSPEYPPLLCWWLASPRGR